MTKSTLRVTAWTSAAHDKVVEALMYWETARSAGTVVVADIDRLDLVDALRLVGLANNVDYHLTDIPPLPPSEFHPFAPASTPTQQSEQEE